MAADPNLVEFYGRECVHCRAAEPLIDRLKENEGIEITRLETWHNAQNAAEMEKHDKGYCGGVPFFINKKTGKWLCGTPTYDELQKWAKGGK
jgi:thiol-disulfide isomerase/thioredoxin